MTADKYSENNAALTWVGGFPVYLSTVIAAVHALAMVLTAILMACGAEAILQALVFSSSEVTGHFSLWRCVTYAFVHRPPYWFFLLELYFLVVFGREIERYLGRTAFLKLYLTLLLLPPLVLSAAGMLGFPTIYWGSSALNFGVFVGFATLYPRAEFLFNLQARWVALALFAVSALQCLAVSEYVSLGVLVLDCSAACLIVGNMRALFRLPSVSLTAGATRKLSLVPKPPRPAVSVEDSIDPILDKISRTGMVSLSLVERERLEKARVELIARERHH